MSTNKDLYEILNISQNASEDEIKKSYRKLAMKYHPDRNPNDKEAEKKFKEIQKAYDILSNPKQKAKYDQFGFDSRDPNSMSGAGFSGFESASFDLGDVFSQLFGAGGGGFSFGAGGRSNQRFHGANLHYEILITLKEAVIGIKKKINIPVSDNNNKQNTKTLELEIPAGIDNGQSIRLTGQGAPGKNGYPSGDLFIRVVIKPNEIFQREGLDLHCELPISFTTATLGGEVEAPTLTSQATVTVPTGTQTNKSLRIKGKGIKSLRGDNTHGDLYYHIIVETPVNLTYRQKEILKEFERISIQIGKSQSPRQKSFLDKIKSLFG